MFIQDMLIIAYLASEKRDANYDLQYKIAPICCLDAVCLDAIWATRCFGCCRRGDRLCGSFCDKCVDRIGEIV